MVLFGGNHWLLYVWETKKAFDEMALFKVNTMSMELAPDRRSKKYVDIGALGLEVVVHPLVPVETQWLDMYEAVYNAVKEELEKADGNNN